MKTDPKDRNLIWIIIILAATNLSTIGSFYYHRIAETKTETRKQEEQTTIPGDQRTRFFRNELNLSNEQLDQFREINRTFNRTARGIETNLAQLRENLVNELGAQYPDSTRLEQMATDIGENHRKLKQVTTTFYLNMKKICTAEQQSKLHQIFQSMLNKDSQVNLPQQGNRRGRWRNK
ncbi:MAG TPA: periplasmic heavy metal sensor [Prolixibacteraceae bacterium]|nr:periplasmic heavy metal sensor [Prolixibacteraceae bacterium]